MKTYTFNFKENSQTFPCASVTPLGDGTAKYEDFIALVVKVLPVDEAFSKARDKKSKLS